MRRRGFTLIELVVVLGIIAVLAAILFPVFTKAREKARQTSCLSNIKQVTSAVEFYQQDWDEKTPLPYECTLVNGKRVEQAPLLALGSYIHSTENFTCPSPDPRQIKPFSCDDKSKALQMLAVQPYYGFRREALGKKPDNRKSRSYPFLLDTTGSGLWDNDPGSPDYLFAESSDAKGKTVLPNLGRLHNDGLNAGFMDGHCKWVSRVDLQNGLTEKGEFSQPLRLLPEESTAEAKPVVKLEPKKLTYTMDLEVPPGMPPGTKGKIRDANGNVVGKYSIPGKE